MHNLIVNLALFFLISAIFGLVFIVVKLGSVSLYYMNTYTENWSVVQNGYSF